MAVKEKELRAKKKILYGADQTPPTAPLIFSSVQHALLVLSLGMALPVSVAKAAGLSLGQSSSYLAAALFCMGLVAILQTIPGKFLGSGYQSLSTTDSAAICACVLAAQTGGVPLVLGMTIFSGILRFVLGSFAFRLRKLFPPEVTGTMIFILGINLVPTGFKYFLGSAVNGVYNPMYILVSAATLIFMLACALFIKPLKPYTALAGIVFGYILSAVTGVFDLSSLKELGNQPLMSLPIYSDLAFSFDVKVLIPFLIITVAAVVDNIGDFSACQRAAGLEKPDWKSIERGIRGSGLGTALSALIGGSAQSTATTNIGIAGASGIASRKVAYLASGMLMLIAFLPGVSGILSMIPEPVLGATLLYSMCYIMVGGFETISSREMDDKRIFTVFLTIGAAISTLIPGLYDFLPESVSQVLVSPMVMGVCVLLVTTLLCRIGSRKKYAFVTGVGAGEVASLEEEVAQVCRSWCADRLLMRKLHMSISGLCEGIFEQDPEAKLHFTIRYDQMQVCVHMETEGTALTPVDEDAEDISSLSISLAMLPNLFDNVRTHWTDGKLIIDMDADM